MRLVCTSDLHGNIGEYHQLLELAVEHNAQAVVVAGDLLPNTIKIANAVQIQRTFIYERLRPLLSEFRSAHPEIVVYLLAGNDDWAAAITSLDDLEHEGLVYPLHERVVALDENLWLAGYACVPITPFSIKDHERYDGEGDIPAYSFAMAYTSVRGTPERTTLSALLQQPSIAQALETLAQRSDPARTIYTCHTPPHGTALDTVRNQHRGSKALRGFIERYQPLLTLHGHIHEAPASSGHYTEQIGTTWCVNPGHNGLQLHAVVVDTNDIAATLWHTIYGMQRITRQHIVGI